MLFCGVDPGITGAICIISLKRVEIIPMPVNKFTNSGKRETELNFHALNSIFKMISCEPAYMMIEIQQPFRSQIWGKDESTGKSILVEDNSQGLSSTSKTMYNYGAIVMCAVANGIEHKCISARKWQYHLFPTIKTGSTKLTSVAKAQELYPNVNLIPERGRTPSHGYADALLIATYAKLSKNAAMDFYSRS